MKTIKKPLISVVIPYYNNSNTINRCLKSVINQTYKNIEILIIDDGSEDWSKAALIILALNDSRVKIIHHNTNKNGSAARNTGICNSTGQYIAFLDSDDEWYVDHLQHSIETFIKYNNNNLILFSGIKIISGPRNSLVLREFPHIQTRTNQDISEYLFVDDQIISTCSIFTSIEVLLKNKFDERLLRYQDIEFILRVGKSNIDIFFSGKIGVLVHWEGELTTRIKSAGGLNNYSLYFLKEYKHLFTARAYKNFILKHVIPVVLLNDKRRKIISIWINENPTSALTIKRLRILFVQIIIGRNLKIRAWIKKYFLKFI